jgi:hypothetical protein
MKQPKKTQTQTQTKTQTTTPRCPRGSRRNKQTGKCDKTLAPIKMHIIRTQNQIDDFFRPGPVNKHKHI